MSKSKISEEVYDRYLDATVALFMEHYAAALTDSIDAEISDTQNLAFPEELDHRCKRLIRKEAAKQTGKAIMKATKRLLQSVAIFCISVLAVSSLLFLTVKAFRNEVVEFYISHGDGFWFISSNQQYKESTDLHAITFNRDDPLQGLIPTDFHLTAISNTNGRRITAIYENAAGESIRFLAFPSTTTLRIDSEDADYSKETTIMGYNGVITAKGSTTMMAWYDTEANMTYTIWASHMAENKVLAIAEQLIQNMSK
ncbi:MAG: DUF4367 domain-containing protein [Ruminococcaceae bacterium]|nr:DUF4367 domain-containing protein [Oscillospiraceae bacterium]